MIKIISWNLLHRSGACLDEVIELIDREEPDLLLMQEATEQLDGMRLRIGGDYARQPLPDRRHGLAIWSAIPFKIPPTIHALPRGAVVKRICQILDLGEFSVANVHLSHSQVLNRRQLRHISQILPPNAAIIGDCNLLGPSLLPDFTDVGPRGATHIAKPGVPVRIDRCFIRGLQCSQTTILDRGTSDHRPIVVRLAHESWATAPLGKQPAPGQLDSIPAIS